MKLLVIRLSALGDVAMTVPVIDSLARQYPHLQITVLSRPFVQPLFAGMPANVSFRGTDVKQYKGIAGLWRLFRTLRKEGYSAVADLHDVLRTKVVRTLFRLSGIPVACIDKGRKEKKRLVGGKQKRQLATSFQRYAEVFARLHYPVTPRFTSIYKEGKGDLSLFSSLAEKRAGERWIGIAPFAAHAGKVLPEAVTEEVIRTLAQRPDYQVFLFGGGKTEAACLAQWAALAPNIHSVAGRLKLDGELSLMSHLDVMVSMDSANMHLASLSGTPVVSVWGATHPYAGFMGWGQCAEFAVQVDDLPCRPCSIYGNKPCRRGDYACLTRIKAADIVRTIEKAIHA